MKHVKLFEDFGLQNNPNFSAENKGEKFKVTIDLKSENPDAEYGCVAEGVGDTLDEAARFAFALVCKFIVSGDDLEDLKDLRDFEDITEIIYGKDEVENAISSIVKNGELEDNFFGDHGTTSENDVTIERGRFPENGGFLVDQYSFNKYD